ncbi:MAG: iron-sulfur cluster repair di-iron protein [Flavobacteriales bacterium]|nr:iron-sulfur cluster repair di-iron protein [Flavobacteriales bacterium]|tara:strand:- start:5634 stop:6365 length:732 start_codon:yes stop_codon:yes gene_type:complete
MENLSETKVSKIVAQNYKTAKVFSKYGIDFCCNGGIPLSEACEQNSVDVNQVVEEVKEELAKDAEVDYRKMKQSELVDLIVNKHHNYVEETIPILQAYLNKLCQVHGERHPELFEVKELFGQTAGALTMHMKKEELVLFPYIVKMEKALAAGEEFPMPNFGHIDNPISMMEDEHTEEGERLRKIASITDGYTCPPDGCQTYRVAYAVLDEFEKDLHKHIHLENNILFPRAKEVFEQNQTVAEQ